MLRNAVSDVGKRIGRMKLMKTAGRILFVLGGLLLCPWFTLMRPLPDRFPSNVPILVW